MRTAIYLRISDDHNGEQTSTRRQRENCERFIAAEGWTVADVFEDIDVSAFKKRDRPEFERMLRAVQDGEVDAIVAWKLDRIARQHRDLSRLFDVCEDTRAFVRTLADGVDTRTEGGRLVAEVTTSVARSEAQSTSTRVADWHRDRAQKGLPNGGGRRAFGYTKRREAIIPEEAALIREAVAHILNDGTLRSLCTDWNGRGLRAPGGGEWTASSVRRMLLSPALSGQREHRGILTPGTWPAILTPEETERLRAIFRDPRRRAPGRDKRLNLLSGLLRCGVEGCGQVLHSHPRADRVRRYACKRIPGRGGCGRLARLAEPLEEFVTETVIVALEGADITEYVAEGQDASVTAILDSIREAEASLEQLSRDYYADKVISRAEFFAAKDAIETRVTEQRATLVSNENTRILRDIIDAGQSVRDLWAERGLDWRRSVLSALLDHVVVLPALKGRTTFDPTLVRPVWRF